MPQHPHRQHRWPGWSRCIGLVLLLAAITPTTASATTAVAAPDAPTKALLATRCTAPSRPEFDLPATWHSCGDSGFDMTVDSFSFSNYPNAQVPAATTTAADTLDTATLERWFGKAAVCEASSGACRPRPVALEWAKETASVMTAGHCLGMAALSDVIFAKETSPASLQPGAATTRALQLTSWKVQRAIARWMGSQLKPSVQTAISAGTHRSVAQQVASIIELLNERRPSTIILYWSDGGATAGHAVTPITVEWNGGTKAAVVVYDNNDPSSVSVLRIDLAAGTWTGSEIQTNPDQPAYEPTGGTGTFVVLPTSVLAQASPAPWGASTLHEAATASITGTTARLVLHAHGHTVDLLAARQLPGRVEGGTFTPLTEESAEGGVLTLPAHANLALQLVDRPATSPQPIINHLSVMLRGDRTVTIDDVARCAGATCRPATPGAIGLAQSQSGSITLAAPVGAVVTTATTSGIRTFRVHGHASLAAAAHALGRA